MKLNKCQKSIICLMILNFFTVFQITSAQTQVQDTLKSEIVENSLILNDSIHVPQTEFYYADNPRCTISGELPYNSTKIKPISALALGGVYGTVFVLQHIGQMNTIWKDQTDFKIVEDGDYALYADKVGHFYGCYLMSYIWGESLMWAGVSKNTSTWLGALLGLGYSGYVEILDGYGANWGFSPSDLYADIFGASFYVAQNYFPVLQNFTPKFCYYPSPWFGQIHRRPSEIFVDDYSSHTLWLSINVHNLLPDNLKKYWFPWMQLSVGYAARNLTLPDLAEKGKTYDYVSNTVYGDPKYLLSLDVDLVKLLPDGCAFWNWIRQGLNYIKLPTPTLEFSKSGTRFYLLYPFPINIGSLKF